MGEIIHRMPMIIKDYQRAEINTREIERRG